MDKFRQKRRLDSTPDHGPSPKRLHTVSNTSVGKTSFLDLPAELRNKIYALVARKTRLELFSLQFNPATNFPAMLSTCKQIRHEYHDVLFSHAHVKFRILDYSFEPLQVYMEQHIDDTVKLFEKLERLHVHLILSRELLESQGLNDTVRGQLEQWYRTRKTARDKLIGKRMTRGSSKQAQIHQGLHLVYRATAVEATFAWRNAAELDFHHDCVVRLHERKGYRRNRDMRSILSAVVNEADRWEALAEMEEQEESDDSDYYGFGDPYFFC